MAARTSHQFFSGSKVNSRQIDQGVPMGESPQHALNPPALSEQVKEREMKGTSGTIDTNSHDVWNKTGTVPVYPCCHNVIISSAPFM